MFETGESPTPDVEINLDKTYVILITKIVERLGVCIVVLASRNVRVQGQDAVPHVADLKGPVCRRVLAALGVARARLVVRRRGFAFGVGTGDFRVLFILVTKHSVWGMICKPDGRGGSFITEKYHIQDDKVPSPTGQGRHRQHQPQNLPRRHRHHPEPWWLAALRCLAVSGGQRYGRLGT